MVAADVAPVVPAQSVLAHHRMLVDRPTSTVASFFSPALAAARMAAAGVRGRFCPCAGGREAEGALAPAVAPSFSPIADGATVRGGLPALRYAPIAGAAGLVDQPSCSAMGCWHTMAQQKADSKHRLQGQAYSRAHAIDSKIKVRGAQRTPMRSCHSMSVPTGGQLCSEPTCAAVSTCSQP